MCVGRDYTRIATLGASSLWDDGPSLGSSLLGAIGLGAPDMPSTTVAPMKPADPANKTAEDLWAPKGLKDAQALAARMGTNALVVPFQSTNLV